MSKQTKKIIEEVERMREYQSKKRRNPKNTKEEFRMYAEGVRAYSNVINFLKLNRQP